MPDADVVIVGARCAGSSLAIHLARAGVKVILVDRAEFPSETLSTHVVQSDGVQALQRLGVAETLFATTVPLDHVRLAIGGAQTEIDTRESLGAPMLNVRRTTMDPILLEAAAAAGAEVRTDTTVHDVVHDGDRVAGVVTDRGDLPARLVIGADGARSTVAGAVGAEEYAVTQPGRLFLWGYLDGITATDAVGGSLWLGKPHEHGYLAGPTDAGLYMAVAAIDLARKSEVLADRDAFYQGAFAEWPELEAVVAEGTLVDPLRMVSSWRGFFRSSAGPGWALVGDAGHFKDPIGGQGISDALRQSEHLAEAIIDGLGGEGDLDGTLAAWWRWRDDNAWNMYWLANDLGSPGLTPPLKRAIMDRILNTPRHTLRLGRVLNHQTNAAALVTPGLLFGGLARTLIRRDPGPRAVMREARDVIGDELRHWRLRRTVPTPAR